ncbi:MAG: hypothetical protein V1875_03475 [Candidatus Altiarchaeota archaeon]
MKASAAVLIMVMASTVCAYDYTGICFLDAVLRGLDNLSSGISRIFSPTTTTTTSSSTTTSTESTSTTTTDTSTTTSSTTSTTTSTTLFLGKCVTMADCPENSVTYTCDQDNSILIQTTSFTCRNPGTPEASCVGHASNRIDRPCNNVGRCVKGLDYCVK